MMKNKSFNVDKRTFELENSAYTKLSKYVLELRKYGAKTPEMYEIAQDVEERLSEKLSLLTESPIKDSSVKKVLDEIGSLSTIFAEAGVSESNNFKIKWIIIGVVSILLILILGFCGSAAYGANKVGDSLGDVLETFFTQPFELFDKYADRIFDRFEEGVANMEEVQDEEIDEMFENHNEMTDNMMQQYKENVEKMDEDFQNSIEEMKNNHEEYDVNEEEIWDEMKETVEEQSENL